MSKLLLGAILAVLVVITFASHAMMHGFPKFHHVQNAECHAKSVQDGKDAGFLKGPTDTSKLIEIP